MRIFFSPSEAFDTTYSEILSQGIEHCGTKAMIGHSFGIRNPQDKVITTPWRNFKEDYAKKEWEWYLSGNRNADEMAKIAKIWKQCQDKNGNVNSNYGYHWKRSVEDQYSQYDYMLQILFENKESRRAVLSHYDYNEVSNYKLDTPCNLTIQFIINEGKLNMIIFCRSQDLVFGFCNDQYIWACLQEKVLKDLSAIYKDLKPGIMIYHFGHIHIYPRHYSMKLDYMSKSK